MNMHASRPSRSAAHNAVEPPDLDPLSGHGRAASAAEPSSGKSAARNVFLWLRQIARDPELPPLGYRLAIELSQCVDRRKGYAHPSHGWLASELDVSRRGVQMALKSLQDRGHLDVTVSRGAGHANRYRLRLLRPVREAA
ncbi:hypothetical protein [Methylobacterium sp. 1973]|uniref:hypothetical protein n=1 Tax=Methylobacterium sp. 1973 TaxID=3156421 RepID=UPI003398B711